MNNALIVSDPHVMMGKPVVAGTRITVELILEKLSAGETIEQLLEAHPRLTNQAVLAALGFAAQAIRADVVYPVVGQPARTFGGLKHRPADHGSLAARRPQRSVHCGAFAEHCGRRSARSGEQSKRGPAHGGQGLWGVGLSPRTSACWGRSGSARGFNGSEESRNSLSCSLRTRP